MGLPDLFARWFVGRGWAPRRHQLALIELAKSGRSALLIAPTGGGKTEAYLGLTAYTLGLRRLQGIVEGRSGENGVTVLMRYTLRLLTLQQFQQEEVHDEELLLG